MALGIILMMAAINVLYGQMIVKNSLQTELVRVTSDGLVGVNTPTPSKLVSVKGAGVNAINMMPKSAGSNVVGLEISLDGSESINNGSAGIYITNLGKKHGLAAGNYHHMGMNIASALADDGYVTENSRNWTFLPGGGVLMSTHIGLADRASGWTQAFGSFSNLHGDRLVTENFGQIGAAGGALSAVTLVPNPAAPFIAGGSMGFINNLTTDTRYVRGVMGRLNQIESWYSTLNGTNGVSAAVSGEVFDNTQNRPGVYAGYFSGAKSCFSHAVGIGTTDPSSALDVVGDVELASNNAFYLGDPNTDGSWRIIRSGNNLVFQSRQSGVWTNGTFNVGAGGAIIQP